MTLRNRSQFSFFIYLGITTSYDESHEGNKFHTAQIAVKRGSTTPETPMFFRQLLARFDVETKQELNCGRERNESVAQVKALLVLLRHILNESPEGSTVTYIY